MKTFSSLIISSFMLFAANAAQADCRSVFNEIKAVLSNGYEDYAFVYSYNKVRWEYGVRHGGYSSGVLHIATDGHLKGTNVPTYTQEYDRYNTAEATKRVGNALFDFYPDGRMALTLPEWGNTTIDVQNATCYSDQFGHYVTGMRREGNGTATVCITFQKQVRLI